MPESASRRHRRWPAGRPGARLAAIVLVLTAVAAGPGGAELAVLLASSAAAGLVGLALAVSGLVVPAVRPAPCRGCVRADREQSQGLHEIQITGGTPT